MKLMMSKSETTVLSLDKAAGKAIRPQSIQDTYGLGKPTRTNPVGGYMAMQCFSGSPDQKKSPVVKPGKMKYGK